jgi:hypothetical protein
VTEWQWWAVGPRAIAGGGSCGRQQEFWTGKRIGDRAGNCKESGLFGRLVPVLVLEKKLPCCPTFFDFDYDYEHQFIEHDHDPNVTTLWL